MRICRRPPLRHNSQPLKPRKKRSSRIPDFAQLIYKLRVYRDKTLDNPPNYMGRIVLLAEPK
jgi:hypothetical protein